MFKSLLEPSPLNYESTAMFVENIFDTVKKNKAAKAKSSSVNDATMLSTPFEYTLSDIEIRKSLGSKKKPRKSLKKNVKGKKTVSPKKKANLRKAKPQKKASTKSTPTKTPRKYTKRATKISAPTDIDDEEAAFILSSISQRSFDSFYSRVNGSCSNKTGTTESPSNNFVLDQTYHNGAMQHLLDHNYWMSSEVQTKNQETVESQSNEIEIKKATTTVIGTTQEVETSPEIETPSEIETSPEIEKQTCISFKNDSTKNVEINNNKHPTSPESAKKRWLRMVSMSSNHSEDESFHETSTIVAKTEKIIINSPLDVKIDHLPIVKIQHKDEKVVIKTEAEENVKTEDRTVKVEIEDQTEKTKNEPLNENSFANAVQSKATTSNENSFTNIVQSSATTSNENIPKKGSNENKSKEDSREDLKESPKEVLMESSKEVLMESPKKDLNESPKEVLNESPKKVLNESSKEVLNENPKIILNKIPNENFKKSSKKDPEEGSKKDYKEDFKVENTFDDEILDRSNWEKVLSFHENSIEKLMTANKRFAGKEKYGESHTSTRTSRFRPFFSRFNSVPIHLEKSSPFTSCTQFQRSISRISPEDPRRKIADSLSSEVSNENDHNYNIYKSHRPLRIEQKSDLLECLWEKRGIDSIKLHNFDSEKLFSSRTTNFKYTNELINNDLNNLISPIKPKVAIHDPRLNQSLLKTQSKEESETPKKKVNYKNFNDLQY